MKEVICTVCPKGCRMSVDEEGEDVLGAGCERGKVYGKSEVKCPVRTLTSTVKVTGGGLSRCPVKTSAPIPKTAIRSVMEKLNEIMLQAPVHMGEIAIKNICETGADIVITRSIP